MPTSNINSRPRSELLGTQDKSTGTPVVEEISLPQHLPWGPTFAAWGDETPSVFLGGGAVNMYGADTFDDTGSFCTQMTPYINRFVLNTNPILYHRLIPPTATKAILRLSAEAIKTEIPVYARNNDGSIKYQYNETNQRVPVVDKTIIGSRLVYHAGVEIYPADGTSTNQQAYGEAQIIRDFRANTTLGADGTQLATIADTDETWTSTVFPIYDFELSYFGKRGDTFGLRTTLLNAMGANPIDTANVYHTKSYLLRLGVVELDATTGGYNLISSTDGNTSIDVSLKDNVRSEVGKVPLSLDKAFIGRYNRASTGATPAIKGPYGKVHVYREAIEELQSMLINGVDDAVGEESYNEFAEMAYGRVPLTDDTQYLLNFLGGFDVEGVPYFTFDQSRSANFGGVTFVNDTVIYPTGGSDGLYLNAAGEPDELANYELFDSLVQAEMKNFGSGTVRWLNSAKYPVSAFWDAGYSIETKKALITPIGKRKDVAVILATQSVADYVTKNVGGKIQKVWSWLEPNNEAEETAIAGSLRTYAAAYPESEVYGTGCCRAIIVGQCGTLINGTYPRKLPVNYELADKVSKFMGAASGFWDDAAAYDVNPNNVLTLLTDINLSWKDPEVADKAWANGLVYAEDYDLNGQYLPAVRTVYTKDTSVLNSSVTMFAITYIQRVCNQSWRQLVGSGKFSRASFIQRSNRIISEALAKKFDDRFIIVVNTHFTSTDESLGFSWNCLIDIYAPNMMLVGKYTIGANRLEDYIQQAA